MLAGGRVRAHTHARVHMHSNAPLLSSRRLSQASQMSRAFHSDKCRNGHGARCVAHTDTQTSRIGPLHIPTDAEQGEPPTPPSQPLTDDMKRAPGPPRDARDTNTHSGMPAHAHAPTHACVRERTQTRDASTSASTCRRCALQGLGGGSVRACVCKAAGCVCYLFISRGLSSGGNKPKEL